MPNYRQPTDKESKKLNEARKKTSEGIEAEKDMFSKLMPTMAKSARDDIRAGKAAGSQTVGVLCGFGTERELRKAGADLILRNTGELLEIFK